MTPRQSQVNRHLAMRISVDHPSVLNQLAIQTTQFELELEFPADLPCFLGHFPDFPILPGVVQLKWAIHYAHEHLSTPMRVIQIDRLKFTAPIQPNMRVKLHLQYFPQKGFTEFKYFNAAQSFSQGRLQHA